MQDLIKIILNIIIPSNTDKSIPGAGDLVTGKNISCDCPEFNKLINFIQSLNEFDRLYIDGDLIEVALNDFKRLYRKSYHSIIIYTLENYYSNKLVLESIGTQSNPPFPEGNVVPESDLTVFGDVFLRGKIYRRDS